METKPIGAFAPNTTGAFGPTQILMLKKESSECEIVSAERLAALLLVVYGCARKLRAIWGGSVGSDRACLPVRRN
jgi:hypothetical protein